MLKTDWSITLANKEYARRKLTSDSLSTIVIFRGGAAQQRGAENLRSLNSRPKPEALAQLDVMVFRRSQNYGRLTCIASCSNSIYLSILIGTILLHGIVFLDILNTLVFRSPLFLPHAVQQS
jgi:hypothetical protein